MLEVQDQDGVWASEEASEGSIAGPLLASSSSLTCTDITPTSTGCVCFPVCLCPNFPF